MSEERPRVVHVGYHRTGSSWLQKNVFHSVAGLGMVPRRVVTEQLILPGPLSFDPELARRELGNAVAAIESTGSVAVVSHERLSGNPHSGGYDSVALADRLVAVAPGAKILIVIREQRALIHSVYRRYVEEGGACSLERYVRPPSRGEARVPTFRFEFFEFDRLIEVYRARFGAEAVSVLPFEQLARDRVGFLRTLTHLVGLDVTAAAARDERRNEGLSAPAIAVKRQVNRFVVRDTLNPSGLVDRPASNEAAARVARTAARLVPRRLASRAEDRLRNDVDALVGVRYACSNQRTARLTGLDLDRWGYPV
jgi:hypothetical protein